MRLRNELRAGDFDVVHVHEPIAPLVGWDACCFDGAPVVGTFHAYSAKWLPNAIASALGARRVLQQAARPDRGVGSRALDRRALLRRHATT